MSLSFKDLIQENLYKVPRLYAKIYRARKNWNLDKFIFLNLIRPGDTVIDGGANVGNYSLLFSKIVGMSGRVLSFEPTPPTFMELKENVSKWGLSNVTPLNQGLGDANEEMEINMPSGVSGYASLANHQDLWGACNIERFEVDIVR